MRGRSYSYSPSPPRSSRRYRSPSPRNRYNGRDKDLPISLLVRNLGRDCREPRDFGFVQYVYPADAADAKRYLDGEVVFGTEIRVIFAEENRKKPSEMRARDRVRGRSYDYRRSPSRYSSSPSYTRSRSLSPEYYSPSPRGTRNPRSISPRYRRYMDRSYSRSPYRSRSQSWDYRRSQSRSVEYSDD